MTKLFVFDLDGTLADITHRLYLIKHPLNPKVCHPSDVIEKHKDWKPDWPSFYRSCEFDSPKQWVIDLLRLCRREGEILILSGRSDEVKGYTEDWLRDNLILYDYLVMRPKGNHEPDKILKKKMLLNFLRDKDFKVQFVVDDRQCVVDMWRDNGYNVLQCDQWDEN